MIDKNKPVSEDQSIEEIIPSHLDKEKIRINVKTKALVIAALSENEKCFFEEMGYISHLKDNSKVEVVNTELYGRGVFAKSKIEKGEVIAEFSGEKYWALNETDLPDFMVDHTIQVGEEEHIHGCLGLAELANHACGNAANCGIKNDTEITALRDINPNEEIRWDYRRSEDSDWYLDGDCQCGASNCTTVVGPFRTLPNEMKQQYLSDGFTSDWILSKYNRI